MTDDAQEVKLTNKQKAFIDEYLLDFNATQAAIRAGYSERTAYSIGSRLLKDVEVSDEISRRLAERRMSADEVLDRITDIARGDLGEYFDNFGQVDVLKLKGEHKSKLIKKLKQRTITKIGKKDDDDDTEVHDIEIELYSAHEALRDLAKLHGLFVDKKDITSNGKTIEVIFKGQDE